MQTLRERLADERPLLLDGATGTELCRRGVGTSLPLWSARALLSESDRKLLHQIHRDYVAAGAGLITANTFRTHARNLGAAGLAHRADELTQWAVDLARRAADGRAWVAGSLAPLEDCYSPELVHDEQTLYAEHAETAARLADAGVDAILVETQNTICEAVAATGAATRTGLPVLTSFVCGFNGRLLSGESLAAAVRSVLTLEPLAVLINCVPAEAALGMLAELQGAAGELPCGVYANVGYADPVVGWINTDSIQPERYARHAAAWIAAGARLIGGCCGTTPAHIAELRKVSLAV